jgi:hypothetical protein
MKNKANPKIGVPQGLADGILIAWLTENQAKKENAKIKNIKMYLRIFCFCGMFIF